MRGQKTGLSRSASGSTGFGGGVRGHLKTAGHTDSATPHANPPAAIATAPFHPMTDVRKAKRKVTAQNKVTILITGSA